MPLLGAKADSNLKIEGTAHRAPSPAPSPKLPKTNGAKPGMTRMRTESSQSSGDFSALFSSSATEVTTASSASFSESSFKRIGAQRAVHETCSNLNFRDGKFYADCQRDDGGFENSCLDLDQHIGNIDGVLTWGAKGFTQSCQNIFLDGWFLVAECLCADGETYKSCRIDLRHKLCNKNGCLAILIIEKKLSKILTEVPWMKFKVIAEPDLSIFAGHPVVKEAMVKIAESTVQHVTVEMSQKIMTAVQEAISIVTMSAMRHITTQLELVVEEVIVGAGAHAHTSCTEGVCLHRMKDCELSVCDEKCFSSEY